MTDTPVDLTARIRERLEGWAAPDAWVRAFAETQPRTPEEIDAFARIIQDAITAPVVVMPPGPRFYPGFTQMQAALLAVLDGHEPVHYDGVVEYAYREEPVFSADGTPRGLVRVRGEPLPPDWCATCCTSVPCDLVRDVARELGIAIHDSRIEGRGDDPS